MFGSKTAVLAAVAMLAAALIPQLAAAQALAANGHSAAPAGPPPPPLTPISLEGDAARGAVLATTCGGCHGIPGSHNATPAYYVPKLGGQNADYLEVALQGYRRGTRSHPTMIAQASTLSDQDIADIAAYFTGRAGAPTVGVSDASAQDVAEGRRKAVACQQCHGETGVAAAAQWPSLGGQHRSYLEQALHQYKSGQRVDMLMGPLIKPLDETTISQLAAYFSAQPYLHSTPNE